MKWKNTKKAFPQTGVSVLVYREKTEELGMAYMSDDGWWIGEMGELVSGITHWTKLTLPEVEA